MNRPVLLKNTGKVYDLFNTSVLLYRIEACVLIRKCDA